MPRHERRGNRSKALTAGQVAVQHIVLVKILHGRRNLLRFRWGMGRQRHSAVSGRSVRAAVMQEKRAVRSTAVCCCNKHQNDALLILFLDQPGGNKSAHHRGVQHGQHVGPRGSVPPVEQPAAVHCIAQRAVVAVLKGRRQEMRQAAGG